MSKATAQLTNTQQQKKQTNTKSWPNKTHNYEAEFIQVSISPCQFLFVCCLCFAQFVCRNFSEFLKSFSKRGGLAESSCYSVGPGKVWELLLQQNQNIVADKMTVKLEPGSCPNTLWEVNSA